MTDFYVKPRFARFVNACNPHNPDKRRKALRKALRRLNARREAFVAVSSGGHECHKPGSMKKGFPRGVAR